MRVLSGQVDIELWNDNNLGKVFVLISFCMLSALKIFKNKKRKNFLLDKKGKKCFRNEKVLRENNQEKYPDKKSLQCYSVKYAKHCSAFEGEKLRQTKFQSKVLNLRNANFKRNYQKEVELQKKEREHAIGGTFSVVAFLI